MQKLKRLGVSLLPHRLAIVQTVLLLVCSFVVFTSQASAVIRLNDRSMFVYDPEPSVISKYTISFTYNTSASVGSIDILFCNDPIPDDVCNAPAGIDASNAVLTDQTGETGFTIQTETANHIVLTRPPGIVNQTPSTYTFDNIKNPSRTIYSYSARLGDYASTDASGIPIDIGSVITSLNIGIVLQTQVPPMLLFCLGHQVNTDCTSQTGGNFSDLGELDAKNTLTATSQMAAGTNASQGYVITAYGTSMEAGTNVITPLASPTVSAPGNSQFGLNLAANTQPAVGDSPDGASTNANPTTNYSTANKFMFQDGDVVASAPNVSLFRRYTVSYIVNVPPDLRAGVYTATITYICTGRF